MGWFIQRDSDIYPFIDKKHLRGFMRKVLFSVTVAIHEQIGELKKRRLKPHRIRLCPVSSIRFCYEQNHKNTRISEGPQEYLGLPIVYRDESIIGVMVEPSEPP